MSHLHPQLLADCHTLGNTAIGTLLLHRNAALPWLILVPDTEAIELHELELSRYHQVMSEVRALAAFLKIHYRADRINVATIGNRVPRLHIHIIARTTGDACWPETVWGHLKEQIDYSETDIEALRAALRAGNHLR